jgi:predicted DNA binding CopG/RHH family protein
MTNKIKLDAYESEILDAFESGKLVSVESDVDFQEIARNTIKKNQKINIRIADNDLAAIKRRAVREGIPYQA